MSNCKKTLSLLLSLILLCALSVNAFAVGNGEEDSPNIGVSAQPLTRGKSRPTKLWDISNRYDFSATSASQDMYTNYYFTGRTSYRVHVENHSDYTLRVRVKSFWSTYADNKIPPHSTDSTYTVGELSANAEIYILFSGDHQNFSGYIEAV